MAVRRVNVAALGESLKPTPWPSLAPTLSLPGSCCKMLAPRLAILQSTLIDRKWPAFSFLPTVWLTRTRIHTRTRRVCSTCSRQNPKTKQNKKCWNIALSLRPVYDSTSASGNCGCCGGRVSNRSQFKGSASGSGDWGNYWYRKSTWPQNKFEVWNIFVVCLWRFFYHFTWLWTLQIERHTRYTLIRDTLQR